jgi:hypothetical protein
MAETSGSKGAISLQEFLEQKIEALTLIMNERQAATRSALSLQAKEYERRLADLNHAHAQAQQMLATYVPRETWAERQKTTEKKVEDLVEALNSVRLDVKAAEARAAGKLWALGIALTLMGLAIGFATFWVSIPRR